MYYAKNKNSADKNFDRSELDKILRYEKIRENETSEERRIMDELEYHVVKCDERMVALNPFVKGNERGDLHEYQLSHMRRTGLIEAMAIIKGIDVIDMRNMT